VLGVHPNTIRSWSDAGRLRYYRINPRGDRRYRMGDLQRFLSTLGGAEPTGTDERLRDGRRRGSGATHAERLAVDVVDPVEEPSGALATEAHAILALVGMLGDLTASAIRESVVDPVAPLASRGPGDPRRDRRAPGHRLGDPRRSPGTNGRLGAHGPRPRRAADRLRNPRQGPRRGV